ncbi:MAG: UvrD-helicase domain-containing protein [Paracoccaceae bacterium]|nr:UvrD-helicase domain-containing protein [Paracoccaceae bacterium]
MNRETPSISSGRQESRPPPKVAPSYLDALNPAQREAVETLDGPVLMLAGAGTGKTRALTTRIAHLINARGLFPNRILAVTFTNRAAREMKFRVGQLLGTVVEGMPWLGTFHSISARMLRRHAALAGLESNFTILDTDDQLRLLKQVLEAENLDPKHFPVRPLAGLIDQWKNRAWEPEDVPQSEVSRTFRQAPTLYARYQERLQTFNAVDFGDLLLHMVRILKRHEHVLEGYWHRFRYILVDEYQDTNVAQYLWLRLLASGHRNICCVGDDDQSIYGWRGAEVGNILRFEKDFPGARVIRLEQNYRSTPHILAGASALISRNSQRLGKTLWTDIDDGERIRVVDHYDSHDEAAWISAEIEAFSQGLGRRDAISLDGMAILVRTAMQMRVFEDRFLQMGLPYRVIGGPRFYERMEIRDAIAYFRLAVSPADSLAFERIVNTPRRGIGTKSLQEIYRTARARETSQVEAARWLVAEGAFTSRARNALLEFIANLDRWRAMIRDGEIHHVEVARQILDGSGYTGHWQSSKALEAPGRLENLKELVQSLEEFENLQGFLDHVSLVMDNERETGEAKVSLMTLHAAKGLEFPVVFLSGWEDGLFPLQRAMNEGGNVALEEERRLGYVGITRAERHCIISYAARRVINGMWNDCVPSRFIVELPESHVDGPALGPDMGMTPYGQTMGREGFAPLVEAETGTMSVMDTPGLNRLEKRRSKYDRAPSPVPGRSPGGAWKIAAGPEMQFSRGDRVLHQKFGRGTILEIDGDSIQVEFDPGSVKMIKAGFLTPA